MSNGKQMTERQEQAIEWVKNAAKRAVCTTKETEIKSITVTVYHHNVMVQLEAGKVGDEGTYGSLFNRVYGCFVIGPKGSIKAHYCKPGNATKDKIVKHPLIYGFVYGLGSDQCHVYRKRI